MRWDDLFADMEAQLAAQRYREIEAEAAEMIRAENSEVILEDRCVAHLGGSVEVSLCGGVRLNGVMNAVGKGWAVLEDFDHEILIPLAAMEWIDGLGNRRQSPEKRRRLGLPHALRALAMARVAVRVYLRSGPTTALEGTVDRAGGDHLDLALHPHDEFRRRRTVRAVRTIPYTAVSCVVADNSYGETW